MSENQNTNIVLSTMTTTGLNAASDLQGVKVVFSPLDSPIAVCGFFKSFKPKLLIIIDTELWPNMLDKAKKEKVPVLIVNARMQEKNCVSYLKHKTLVQDLISSKLTKVMCMSHADKDRFIKIGVDSNNAIVTGNLKYDLTPKEGLFIAAKKQKQELLKDKVFGAISIHAGEETAVIDAFIEAKKEFSNLKLVFVGRHKNDCEKAISYIEKTDLTYQKRSLCKEVKDFTSDVLIGDTLGEIEFYFGLCDLVFMGGSL